MNSKFEIPRAILVGVGGEHKACSKCHSLVDDQGLDLNNRNHFEADGGCAGPVAQMEDYVRTGPPLGVPLKEKESLLSQTVETYHKLALALRNIVVNGRKPETEHQVQQCTEKLDELGKKYADALIEGQWQELKEHPERVYEYWPGFYGASEVDDWGFAALEPITQIPNTF